MTDSKRLARARGYPYAFPRTSFVYIDGAVRPFDVSMTRGRTPVLAFGSNQAPERLTQKFGHQAGHIIPVERGKLENFDVVFSAHLTNYGSIAAMLQVCKGAAVELAITWLDDDQLAIMHETEISAANYFFGAMENINLRGEYSKPTGTAYAYVGRRGHFLHEGDAVALSVIACDNRRFPGKTTAEMLEIVRQTHAPDQDPDGFILRVLDDPAYRDGLTAKLEETSIDFDFPVRPLA